MAGLLPTPPPNNAMRAPILPDDTSVVAGFAGTAGEILSTAGFAGTAGEMLGTACFAGTAGEILDMAGFDGGAGEILSTRFAGTSGEIIAGTGRRRPTLGWLTGGDSTAEQSRTNAFKLGM